MCFLLLVCEQSRVLAQEKRTMIGNAQPTNTLQTCGRDGEQVHEKERSGKGRPGPGHHQRLKRLRDSKGDDERTCNDAAKFAGGGCGQECDCG